MATIGILVPPWSGHLNPMNTLGRELALRGHRVVVPLFPDGEAPVRAAGLEFVSIGADRYPPGTMKRVDAALGALSGRAALKYTIEALAGMSLTFMRDSPAVFRAAGAEVILVDQALPVGGTVP
ncbi:MAG TPA: hypothetical protein VGH38_05440, partial [Bryobacteraceae bacterium]